jgi:precorrin-6B methylase 2
MTTNQTTKGDTKMTTKQMAATIHAGETGGSVTLAVIRAMPNADAATIDRQIERVYDAMEYPEAR